MTTVCFWAAAGLATESTSSARIRARAPRERVSMKRLLGVGVEASLGHEAAVHDHLGSGHEGGFIGGEEERGIRDVAGLADPPQRDPGLELGTQCVVEVGGLQRGLD